MSKRTIFAIFTPFSSSVYWLEPLSRRNRVHLRRRLLSHRRRHLPWLSRCANLPSRRHSLWEKYGGLLLAAVIGGIVILVFADLLGPLFQHWGEQLRDQLKGEAGRFMERYIPALAEAHRDLKLVGISSKEGMKRPPLKEVYVSLNVGDAQTSDAEALSRPLSIVQAMSQHDKLLILGEPGAGKSTLLDWLTLVFCGGNPAASTAAPRRPAADIPSSPRMRCRRPTSTRCHGRSHAAAVVGWRSAKDSSRPGYAKGAAWCCWMAWTK